MVKYYYHSWTEEEEKILTEIMVNGRKNRKKMDELFKEAAEKLSRTESSCANYWYKLRKKHVESAM